MPAMARKKSENHANIRQWKGVRKRAWGRWVSEIRKPFSKERIWLGSYATAEEAARAFDAASLCLRGPSASLNFPSSIPLSLLLRSHQHPLSATAIQSIAATAAAAEAVQNEGQTRAPPQPHLLADIRQESQTLMCILPKEIETPMPNPMEFPSHEMQASIQHGICLPPSQLAVPMQNIPRFYSPEMQASTQHQICMPLQGAAAMENRAEFLSQAVEASAQHQLCLPAHQIYLPLQSHIELHHETWLPSHEMQASMLQSQDVAQMQDQADHPKHREEFPGHVMQASTHLQTHLPTCPAAPMHIITELPSHDIMPVLTHHQIHHISQNVDSDSTPTMGTAFITGLPNPSAVVLHPKPSVQNSHLAIPAMVKHFWRKAQMQAQDSSHPTLQGEGRLFALPLEEENGYR